MFSFDISDKLKLKMRKLFKKYPKRVEIINRKIKEIIQNNADSIDRYKNLRNELKNFKRVHIDRQFVLVFNVNKKDNYILFLDYDHHDRIYKK